MPISQEICVFFPCHTLEDFPTHLRDESADGLLAAWTAPWHPAIIAATGGIPVWHRADTPPVELKQRLLLIPSASQSRLPHDLQGRVSDAFECHQISVTSRETTTKQIFDFLGLDSPALSDSNDSAGICVADFFALGYLALQIQVMTRRLRYSSNLDQVTFSEHVVAAARAFVAKGDASATDSAAASLQAAFDLLAEERDHYFSSDPHLIDLILVAPSTLGQPLFESLEGATPVNLLMSAETAERIAREHPEIAARIRQRHAEETLSLVGGAPDDHSRLDHLGSSAVSRWIEKSLERTEAALGIRPIVFGRLGGGIPGDLPPWLVNAGFRGAITNDFFSGVGWQEEPKMLWQSGGAELEALTAKPMEVVQPQTFLGLGAKLGEIADAGQVSVALLVRWPGTDCLYKNDLRHAAKRTLALGHFWTLDRFFTHGERPYHGCSLPAVVADGVGLDAAVQSQTVDPLSSVARQFQAGIQDESAALCQALQTLVAPQATAVVSSTNGSLESATLGLVSALGFQPANERSKEVASLVVLNPHCGPARAQCVLPGPPPATNTEGLFGSSKSKDGTRITLDVPGNGFAAVQSSSSAAAKSTAVGKKKRLFGLFTSAKPLAKGQSLSNEFLDVAIHPKTGAVAAVHAGQQRGNRFSWQLAYYDSAGPDNGYSRMVANSVRVLHADEAVGTIVSEGELRLGEKCVGRFTNHYSVHRGSRWLEIETQLSEFEQELDDQPWKNYVCGRATWASEALSIRPLVRDKRHRTNGKRIEAPLGILVDEGDRKLQVCSYGLPAHRRIGTKELDTLLVVRGETARSFRLAYGFDVPAPARSARQHLLPPLAIPLGQLTNEPRRGWLIDVDARSVVICNAAAVDAQTVEIVAVETSGKPTRAKFSLFRDIVMAFRKTSDAEPKPEHQIAIENGAATLGLGGHEVVSIRLKLAP